MNNLQVLLLAVTAAACGSGCDFFASSFPDSGSPLLADSTVPDGSGCSHEYDRVCYDYPVPVETHVVPMVGHYVVRPADPSISVAPMDNFGFDVMAGQPYVNFTVDTFMYSRIFINNGAFSRIHGAGFDGTFYPTDGFIVTGSFVTPTEAEGFFQYMPSLVRRVPGNFVATYVP